MRKYDKGREQIADHGFMCQRNEKKQKTTSSFSIKELVGFVRFSGARLSMHNKTLSSIFIMSADSRKPIE